MLKLLMASVDVRTALGHAGHDYVQREYSWEIAAERTERLLNKLRNE